MKKPEEELAGLIGVALVTGLMLLIALPVGYVIKVLVRTRSTRLLGTVLIFAPIAALAALSQATWLVWMAAMLGLVVLVVARVEEVRPAPRDRMAEFIPLPFEGYRW